MAEHRRPKLCIGILTLNQANRIARCIQSAAFADEVVVIDSGSEDRPREIAQELGAQVHPYADGCGFAEQDNRPLTHVIFRRGVLCGAEGFFSACWRRWNDSSAVPSSATTGRCRATPWSSAEPKCPATHPTTSLP